MEDTTGLEAKDHTADKDQRSTAAEREAKCLRHERLAADAKRARDEKAAAEDKRLEQEQKAARANRLQEEKKAAEASNLQSERNTLNAQRRHSQKPKRMVMLGVTSVRNIRAALCHGDKRIAHLV